MCRSAPCTAPVCSVSPVGSEGREGTSKERRDDRGMMCQRVCHMIYEISEVMVIACSYFSISIGEALTVTSMFL